jgi:hypothetical protein
MGIEPPRRHHVPKKRGSRKDPPEEVTKQGVDTHLADRARKAAAMLEEKFEVETAKAMKISRTRMRDEIRIALAQAERLGLNTWADDVWAGMMAPRRPKK